MRSVAVVLLVLAISRPCLARGFGVDELKEEVKDGLENGILKLPEVSFEVNKKDRTYDFSITCTSDYGTSVLDYPVRLELLYLSLKAYHDELPFKPDDLRHLKRVIREQLEVIDDPSRLRSGVTLRQKLKELEDVAFNEIVDEAERFAKKKKLKPQQKSSPCSGLLTVNVVTDPPGGNVYFMCLGTYLLAKQRARKLNDSRGLDDLSNWENVGKKQTERRLSGKYMFIIEHKGKRTILQREVDATTFAPLPLPD